MTTPPFSTAVVVCAQVCVQRVLLSVITEVEEVELSAVEVMSGLPSFHCVMHSNMCVVPYCCGAITINVLYLQDGSTPLCVASRNGHLPVLECLIGANADVNHHKKVSSAQKAVANYPFKQNYACLNRSW